MNRKSRSCVRGLLGLGLLGILVGGVVSSLFFASFETAPSTTPRESAASVEASPFLTSWWEPTAPKRWSRQ